MLMHFITSTSFTLASDCSLDNRCHRRVVDSLQRIGSYLEDPVVSFTTVVASATISTSLESFPSLKSFVASAFGYGLGSSGLASSASGTWMAQSSSYLSLHALGSTLRKTDEVTLLYDDEDASELPYLSAESPRIAYLELSHGQADHEAPELTASKNTSFATSASVDPLLSQADHGLRFQQCPWERMVVRQGQHDEQAHLQERQARTERPSADRLYAERYCAAVRKARLEGRAPPKPAPIESRLEHHVRSAFGSVGRLFQRTDVVYW
jgi:hypothetical protein